MNARTTEVAQLIHSSMKRCKGVYVTAPTALDDTLELIDRETGLRYRVVIQELAQGLRFRRDTLVKTDLDTWSSR